jgi:hypothetical protein
MTILERLREHVRLAAAFNSHDLSAAAVVLWTDGERLWESSVAQLRLWLPELWVLGDYKPEDRTGPVSYLRYQLGRTPAPVGRTTVLYLPGVSHAAFRSVSECPESAIHAYALQFEGEFWTQKNGRDWTPFAFLASKDGGLGLDLAQDSDTKAALGECLTQVLDADVTDLQGKRLEAADFRTLSAPDPIRLLLRWLGDPDAIRKQWTKPEWNNFRSLAKSHFKFDPDGETHLAVVERLAMADGPWLAVWERFAEGAASYPLVRKALELVSPSDLFTHREGYPSVNKKEEAGLRAALIALRNEPLHTVAATIRELAKQHAQRAKWVWAKLHEAPLAVALVHLQRMVDGQAEFGFANDWEDLAQAYRTTGWKIDEAALRAVSASRFDADADAVACALQVVYRPWLERLAEHVQARADRYPVNNLSALRALPAEKGTLALFVDGLRYDVGRLLAEALKADGLAVESAHEWSVLPTVTATAKPAWTPMATRVSPGEAKGTFGTQLAESGKELNHLRFKELLTEVGWPRQEEGTFADPNGFGWVEVANFDHYGHDQGAKMAWRVDEEIRNIVATAHELLGAGWLRIRVITDHGWLLLPKGLPKTELPKHLTDSRWSRCASPQAGAKHGLPVVPWFWDPSQPVVLAPGISCFKAGMEYAHGGLSIQEALLPVLTISLAGGVPNTALEVASLKWKSLRLVVRKAADANSTLFPPAGAQRKRVGDDDEVSLLIENDDSLGQTAVFVLLNDSDQIVLKCPVVVGGE